MANFWVKQSKFLKYLKSKEDILDQLEVSEDVRQFILSGCVSNTQKHLLPLSKSHLAAKQCDYNNACWLMRQIHLAKNHRSQFATAIKGLLYDTNLFSRKQWSLFFGIEKDKLTQWITDKAIPTPSQLNMMIIVLKTSTKVNLVPLEQFMSMINNEWSCKLSPLGHLMYPFISSYMNKNRFDDSTDRTVHHG